MTRLVSSDRSQSEAGVTVSFSDPNSALHENWRMSCDSYSIHQDPCWRALNPPTSQQTYLPFTVTRDRHILSTGHIRLRRVFRGYSIAAIQRGPVVANIDDLGAVVAALETALIEKGVITLTVNPYVFGDQAEAVQTNLQDIGFAAVTADLQNFPTVTAMIDTTQDEAALMSAMTQTGRRHLRKAIKAGVTTRPMASLDEAEQANKIMVQMAAETGLVLDSQHDFTHHYTYLKSNPHTGSILITQVDDQMFGAAVNYMEGTRGYNMLLTTSSDVHVPRAYVLMWDSILAARALGADTFDMVGFPDERVESDGGMQSRGAFKRGFGPNVVRMLPLMSKPLRPRLHMILNKARSVQRARRKAKAGAA